jgi:hypothetical protein
MPSSRLPRKNIEKEKREEREKGRPRERWMNGVRRSTTNHGLSEGDKRHGHVKKLSSGGGKPRYPGHSLDDENNILIF